MYYNYHVLIYLSWFHCIIHMYIKYCTVFVMGNNIERNVFAALNYPSHLRCTVLGTTVCASWPVATALCLVNTFRSLPSISKSSLSAMITVGSWTSWRLHHNLLHVTWNLAWNWPESRTRISETFTSFSGFFRFLILETLKLRNPKTT